MTYQELDNLLDLKSLTDAVSYATSLTNSRGLDFTYNPDPESWQWQMFKARVAALGMIEGYSLTSIVARVIILKDIIYYGIWALWDWMLALPKWFLETKFKRVIEAMNDIVDFLYGEFKEFLRHPGSFIWQKVQAAVKPLIEGIELAGTIVWNIVNKVYNKIYQWLEPRLTTIKDIIWGKIETLWTNIKTYIDNLPKLILDPIGQTFAWIWERIRGFFTESIPNWFERLGARLEIIFTKITTPFRVAIAAIQGFFETLKDIIHRRGTGWENFKDLLSLWTIWGIERAGQLINKIIDVVRSVITSNWVWTTIHSAKTSFAFMGEVIDSISHAFLNMSRALIPGAPSPEVSPETKITQLFKQGASVLGLMAGLGVVASAMSHLKVPYVGAMIADFAAFRYITGAIMGGLVFAAYTQPLKYYYNAIFKPYLPSWGEVTEAFGRSKISDDLFKFFLKYSGIDEKYFSIYKELAARPISAFMIRYIADAEIADPAQIFEICMDNGYKIEHAIYMAYAMSWGANSPYRKLVESALRKCFKEGYISREMMDREIEKARTVIEVPATYTTVDGFTYRATVKAPLDQKTLMAMASEWESFYESRGDKVAAAKTDYSKENITEAEFRARLSELIVNPARLEDIVAREKAKKKAKTEPDKGKTLRDALKSVIRRCYKEGFITKETFESWLKTSNTVVDEPSLLKAQAWWEAYYDDSMDWRKIYEKNLADGLITEAEFRRDLIDMGFRPSKVELLIKYDKAKKLGRVPSEREKLESKLRDLEFRLKDLASDLKAVEEDLAVETEPEKITRLTRRKTEITEDIEKTESEIDLIKAKLAVLPT